MLVGYLGALGAHEAREPILLGDGAKWIWERAADLISRVGIAADRVTQIIDWCHAVGVLHEIADARVSWSTTERERWIKRAKKKLHARAEAAPRLAGLAIGVAAHLAVLAVVPMATLQYVPGVFGVASIWLAVNTVACGLLARLARRR